MKHSLLLVCLFSGFLTKAAIPEKTIQATITDIQAKGVTNTTAIETGVRQVAHLWQSQDAQTPNFKNFARKTILQTRNKNNRYSKR